MTTYIDFTLSYNTFNELIEDLERLCELSDNYMEIESIFCMICNLNRQKKEFLAKENEELMKKLGLEK